MRETRNPCFPWGARTNQGDRVQTAHRVASLGTMLSPAAVGESRGGEERSRAALTPVCGTPLGAACTACMAWSCSRGAAVNSVPAKLVRSAVADVTPLGAMVAPMMAWSPDGSPSPTRIDMSRDEFMDTALGVAAVESELRVLQQIDVDDGSGDDSDGESDSGDCEECEDEGASAGSGSNEFGLVIPDAVVPDGMVVPVAASKLREKQRAADHLAEVEKSFDGWKCNCALAKKMGGASCLEVFSKSDLRMRHYETFGRQHGIDATCMHTKRETRPSATLAAPEGAVSRAPGRS